MKQSLLVALGAMAFLSAEADTQSVKLTTSKEVGTTLTLLVNNSKTGVTMDWGDGNPVAYTKVTDGVIEVTGQVKGADLTLSSERAITMLSADDCGLTAVSLSGATDMLSLYLQNNALTTLDVSKLSKLRDLNVASNALTKLPVTATANPLLETLNVADNAITSTTFSLATEALQYVNVAHNQYKTLTLTKNVNLKSLVADNNQVTTVTLTNQPNITLVSLSGNAISSLRLPEQMTELQQLSLAENELTGNLALADSKKLNWLDVHGNALSFVQLPSVKLYAYDCSDNGLTFSSLPKNTYKPTDYLKYDNQGLFNVESLEGMHAGSATHIMPWVTMSPGYDSRNDAAYVINMAHLRTGSTSSSVKMHFYEVKEDDTEVALSEASATARTNDFANINGKVTFQRALDKVVCVMTDEGYPDLKVRTTYFSVLDPNAPEGITDVNVTVNDNTQAYDLSGRPVNAASQRGIYLINNKKVILK